MAICRLLWRLASEQRNCDEVRLLMPQDSTDTEIADLANELTAVVVSKDFDFVEIVRRGVLATALVHIRLPKWHMKLARLCCP